MVHHDPKTHCRAVKALPKASYGTGANKGLGFTKTGFDYALVMLDLGTLGTAATVDVVIQESDVLADGGTWAAIPTTPATFSQKVKATDDDKFYVAQIKLSARKKFLRAVATVGAAASVVGVYVVLMEADRSEGVNIAQAASEAIAAPTAFSGTGSYEFSV